MRRILWRYFRLSTFLPVGAVGWRSSRSVLERCDGNEK